MKLDCNSSKWIPPTQSCHIRSLLSAPAPPPIRVYGVNNKSCVTSQITQTAYHLFIVVYHNNSSVCTKATASQTQAFVNELGRLPDLKINWQCSGFLPLVSISLPPPPPVCPPHAVTCEKVVRLVVVASFSFRLDCAAFSLRCEFGCCT